MYFDVMCVAVVVVLCLIPFISHVVLLLGFKFSLMNPYFGVSDKVVNVGSIKYIFENAIRMAFFLFHVLILKVTKNKPRIHVVEGGDK